MLRTLGGVTEDGMVAQHHRFNGHEFEQALGDGEGQGSLLCCSPWAAESQTWFSDSTRKSSNPGRSGPGLLPAGSLPEKASHCGLHQQMGATQAEDGSVWTGTRVCIGLRASASFGLGTREWEPQIKHNFTVTPEKNLDKLFSLSRFQCPALWNENNDTFFTWCLKTWMAPWM